MSDNFTIPDTATEAAGEVFYGPVWDGGDSHAGVEVRAALAAAAPYLVADAVAKERERIATAIEAERDRLTDDGLYVHNGTVRRGYSTVAGLARADAGADT